MSNKVIFLQFPLTVTLLEIPLGFDNTLAGHVPMSGGAAWPACFSVALPTPLRDEAIPPKKSQRLVCLMEGSVRGNSGAAGAHGA